MYMAFDKVPNAEYQILWPWFLSDGRRGEFTPFKQEELFAIFPG